MNPINQPTSAGAIRTISELVNRVNLLSKISGSGSVRVNSGVGGIQIIGESSARTNTSSTATTGTTDIRVFQVQGNGGVGDGVYNCYEQVLDATEWDDTAGDDKFDELNTTGVEVLNLLENNPQSTYAAYLGLEDRIAAWKVNDDEGNERWVGIPIDLGRTRRAICIGDAGSGTTISCDLIDPRTGSPYSGVLGASVTVNCEISGGTALNAAIPRLSEDDYIFVTNVEGKWYCTTVFQATENCSCS
jgi:hypothetical protein